MATTTLPGLFDSGDHASRPAATAVGSGALYACSTHALIYQSDGSSWTTWATLGGGANVETLPTAETDDTLVLAPDGAGGVEFRAETGGGGGGLTHAYAGYNTIGGTAENAPAYRQYLQKITLANDCLIASIDVYIKQNTAGNAFGLLGFVYDDDGSGLPLHMLSVGGMPSSASSFNLGHTTGTAGDARWFSTPQGIWVPAGDYWIGFEQSIQAVMNVYYDASGTSYYWDKGGNQFLTDAPGTSGTTYTLTSQTRTYSVRANTIR